MRDEVASKVNYEGLLGLMGDRGRTVLEGIHDMEDAVDDGRISYVSIVARRESQEPTR